jgi:hypothetical protein
VIDRLTGEVFYDFILSSAYMPHNYAVLPYIIKQAEQGHFDLYVALSELFYFHNWDSSGLFYSVICSEHQFGGEVQSDLGNTLPAAVRVVDQHLRDNRDGCTAWGNQPASNLLAEMPPSDLPALLLSGFFDPVTPPEYAEITLPSFSQGQHLIDPVGSHGVAFGDDCTRSLVEDFLEDPTQELDSTCLDDPERQSPFVPPDAVSSPFLVKLLENPEGLISLLFIPAGMMVLMLIRGTSRYLVDLWKNSRDKIPVLTSRIRRLRLQYELATWVFVAGSLAFAVSLYLYIYRVSDIPAYSYALALPGGMRIVLAIPWFLILVLIGVLILSALLWRSTRSVLGRSYYLLQALYGSGTVVFLIWSGLVMAYAH